MKIARRTSSRPKRIMCVAPLLILACATYGHTVSLNVELARVNEQPVAAGTLVYRGSTYPLDALDEAPLFHYERHVLTVGRDRVATHRTYDRAGTLMQSEAVWTSSAYDVRQVAITDYQGIVSGTATVDSAAGTLTFNVLENGRERQKTERLSLPLVSGPSLFGYIHHHWDEVVSSDKQSVRFIVLQDMATYGFTIRAEGVTEGLMVFSVTPTSLLVRLVVPSMHLMFDAQTRQLVRFEGRVPPKDNRTDKLKALDARVEYETLLPLD
ncbi:hypothetical protein NFC81_01960 [Salinispirillum sp. LH 10-3-1]|uniref:DUF3108 domain-containing protein n=1 Tax=Salinispirillum sp. LH 10-3-1 TaxID=2952525 RepID=A0AB38YGU7_9GAMM